MTSERSRPRPARHPGPSRSWGHPNHTRSHAHERSAIHIVVPRPCHRCNRPDRVQVVRGLLARGVRVRALARDVGRAAYLADAGAEIVAGDLALPPTLEAALDRVERAFLLSPSAPDQVELQSAFVRVAKQAGVRHLVKLSGAHANPDAAARFARWHGQVERAIVAADLPHTFVQPVYFMQNVPSQIR